MGQFHSSIDRVGTNEEVPALDVLALLEVGGEEEEEEEEEEEAPVVDG
jgi:hypothetical protein